MATLVRLPVTPLLGSGRQTLPVVHAGNVAEAVALALEASDAPGRIFDVGEEDPVTQRDTLLALARGMGANVRLLPIPSALLETLAHLWAGVVGPLWSSGRPSLVRGVRLATRGNPFSSRKLRDTLGWRPSTGSVEALERTGRCLVEGRGRSENEVRWGPG